MRVDARVEQLDVYPHSVSSLLHAAFEHSAHTEFVRDCLQVFRLTFVFGCGRTRDHLQVTDASEFGQDLILNTVGAALTNRLPPTINNLPFTNHSSFARVVEWQTRTFEGRMLKGMRVQVP